MPVAIEDSTTSAATVIGNSDTVSTITKSGGGNDLIYYPFYGRAAASTPENTVTSSTFGGTNFTQNTYEFFNNVGTQDLYVGSFYVLDTNIPATANPAFSFTNSQALAVSNLGAWFHLSGVDQSSPVRTRHANGLETIIDSASARQFTGEEGDIVIYTVSLNTPNGGLNTPSGFTALVTTTAGDHGDTLLDVFGVYYKILTADETDATIDLPMNATGTFRGWHWADVVKAEAGTNISVTLATLALNAQNATVEALVDTNVSASLATMTLSALNASVQALVDTNVSATAAGLSLTPLNASIEALVDTNVNATLGTLSLTPFNATVSTTNNINVDATLATLSLTPANATVEALVDTNVNATLGALNLSPFNATVDFDQGVQVAATLGELSLTPFNASVEALIDVDINVTAASLTINNLNASVVIGDLAQESFGMKSLMRATQGASGQIDTNQGANSTFKTGLGVSSKFNV